MPTLDLLCGGDHPIHSKTVAVAETNTAGNMFLQGKWRAGKGSSRAKGSGSRLVNQGAKIQVRWSAEADLASDPQRVRRDLEVHRALIGGSLPDSWLIGVYKCPDGHWVGTDDIDELIGWIDKAVRLGLRSLPLLAVKWEAGGPLPLPMEHNGSTKGPVTGWVTIDEPA